MKTNVSCGAFPLYYCNWKEKKFFLNGSENTGQSCESVKLKCSVDGNYVGIYTIEGYDGFAIKDEKGCGNWKFKCVEKNGERQLVSPDGYYVGVLCPKDGEYKCDGVVCNKTLDGVRYVYDSYSDEKECQEKCGELD